jgi:hypothetical protein
VTHLVTQIAQDVRAIEAFDVPDPLAVQLREIGMREIKRNANHDRAERHAPFGREVKARRDLRDAAARELRAEFVDHGLEPRAGDLEPKVANRRGV